jgi:16S rRNA (cytosine967-C5)-methyltransferase
LSRWQAYIRSAEQVISRYDGDIPLSPWLREFFRENKKMGSTDRRFVGSLVYQFYRTCGFVKGDDMQERFLAARFLCSFEADPVLEALKPEWNLQVGRTVADKLQIITFETTVTALESEYAGDVSDLIDRARFRESFLVQPDLFLRVRPGKEEVVTAKLEAAAIPFTKVSEHCFSIPNQSNADKVLKLDTEAVVQDYNSQRTGEFFGLKKTDRNFKVWDCCAASGGKSIMAYDINPEIDLTVSDIRDTILINLEIRFDRAGIKKFYPFKVDLARAGNMPNGIYDTVIADLPCSGSGTWSRTPEQSCFFSRSKIRHYSDLQMSILKNVVKTLKPGGRLVYITCSVFREENEQVVEFAKETLQLTLIDMQYLKGYEMKADTLFVAVFRS